MKKYLVLFTLLSPLSSFSEGGVRDSGGGNLSLEQKSGYVTREFKNEFINFVKTDVSAFFMEGLPLAQISDSELVKAVKKMKEPVDGSMAMVAMAQNALIKVDLNIAENTAEAELAEDGKCHIAINPVRLESENLAEQLNVIGLHELVHCFGYNNKKAHLISAHLAPDAVLKKLNISLPTSRVFVLPTYDDKLVLSRTEFESYRKYSIYSAHMGSVTTWESEREVKIERKRDRADFFCLSQGYSRATQSVDLYDTYSGDIKSERSGAVVRRIHEKMAADDYIFALFQQLPTSLENGTAFYNTPRNNNPAHAEILQITQKNRSTEVDNKSFVDIGYSATPFVMIKCERGSVKGLTRIESHYEGAPWLAYSPEDYGSIFFADEQKRTIRLANLAKERADKICQNQGFHKSGGPLRLRPSSLVPIVYYPRGFNVAILDRGEPIVTFVEEYSDPNALLSLRLKEEVRPFATFEEIFCQGGNVK